MPIKIIHVAGARPNFMKIAPLLRESSQFPEIHNLLVHTGQHYDANMSDVFFDELKLPRPDVNLGVGSGTHAVQTAEIMARFEPVLTDNKPDLVVVVGDVNSTLACSLVAVKLGIPVAHVEAGIRSFDRSMPEEINRIVTDTLSDLLFTPSRHADENLRDQGISSEKIYFVGNVMVDSLLHAFEIARRRRSWTRWDLDAGGYAVLTLHRASNVDDSLTLAGLLDAVTAISPKIPVIFPVHPRTAQRLADSGFKAGSPEHPGLILTEPLGYLDFLCLMGSARMVLTDSGGIQSETTVLGVPCLTLRWNTEWPETLKQGSNRLVGTDKARILSAAEEILGAGRMAPAQPEGWDGRAAERIVRIIREKFGDA